MAGEPADDGPAQRGRLFARPRPWPMPSESCRRSWRSSSSGSDAGDVGRRRRPRRSPAAPSRRARSAKVTSRMALATATPTAMIAPMNDWILSVVRVTNKAKRDAGKHGRRRAARRPAPAAATENRPSAAGRSRSPPAAGRPSVPRKFFRRPAHRTFAAAARSGRGRRRRRRAAARRLLATPARRCARHAPKVFALDVRRHAHQAFHVVAIVFSGDDSLVKPGDVLQEQLPVLGSWAA